MTDKPFSPIKTLSSPWGLALLVLTAIGLFLRLRYLGELGLDRYDDEDIMALAALGILQTGLPAFPTEAVYLRAFPQSYMMAGSISLFGYSEFALRLPSALFGTALIPMAYLIARQFMSRQGALVIATLVCFSSWQIDVSRTARMYAPFAFFFSWTILCFVKEHTQRGLRFPWRTLLVALMAVSFHALGMVLAVLFLLHLMEQPRWRINWIHLGCALLIASCAMATKIGTSIAFSQANYPGIEHPANPVVQPLEVQPPEIAQISPTSETLLGMLFRPPTELLNQTFARVSADGPFVLYLAFSLLIAFLAWALVVNWRSSPRIPIPNLVLWLAAYGASCMHQFHLTSLILLVLLGFSYCHSKQEEHWPIRPLILLLVGLIALSVWWLIWGFIIYGFEPKSLVDQLIDFPLTVTWKRLFDDRSYLAPLLIIAIGYTLLNRKIKDSPRLIAPEVILWCLIGGEVMLGTVDNDFRPRYLFFIDLLVYLLVGYLVYSLVSRLPAYHGKPLGNQPLASVLLLALLLLPFFQPWRAVGVTGATLESMVEVQQKYHLDPWTDRKSTAQYVADHRHSNDIILGLDWINLYTYLGKLDYWVRAEIFEEYKLGPDSDLRELYLGARIIQNGDQLNYLINSICERDLWLVIPASHYRKDNKTNLSLEQFYQQQEEHIVYRGFDGESAVFQFEQSQVPCTL